MPGRRCTVCEHEHRPRIDQLFLSGSISNRAIASQFGLTKTALQRHCLNHVTKRAKAAMEKREEKQADSFLDGIMGGIQSARQGVDYGMSKASEVSAELAYRLAPGFLAQQARYLELLGQATGRLTTQAAGASSINLVVVMPRDLTAAAQPELGPAIECQAIEQPIESEDENKT